MNSYWITLDIKVAFNYYFQHFITLYNIYDAFHTYSDSKQQIHFQRQLETSGIRSDNSCWSIDVGVSRDEKKLRKL